MKTTCIAVSIVFFLSATSIAHTPTFMSMPIKYEEPDGDLVEGKAKYSNKLWLVFSDRDNNNDFGSPSEGTSVLNKVRYTDKFYVTGEAGAFPELYRWNYESGTRITGRKGTV